MGAVNIIAMPGTGHNAIMNWLRGQTDMVMNNLEGMWLRECLDQPGISVLVLRDFPNWLAGRIVRVTANQGYEHEFHTKHLIGKWIDHARAAFSIPTILYPRWVLAGYGNGVGGKESRFPSSDTDHMSRHKYVEDDALYCALMDEFPEAVELSNSIDWVPADH